MGRRRYWAPAQTEPVEHEVWFCRRPLTSHWGSGTVWQKLCKRFGTPDVAFGKTDGIPESLITQAIDHRTGFEWRRLPFTDQHFTFGYWDPPYDKLYKPEGQEIWRTVRRLAILHPTVYPRSWFLGAIREAMVPITFGPLKAVRCLQVFRRAA